MGMSHNRHRNVFRKSTIEEGETKKGRKNERRRQYEEKCYYSTIVKPQARFSKFPTVKFRNNTCARTNDVTTAQLTDRWPPKHLEETVRPWTDRQESVESAGRLGSSEGPKVLGPDNQSSCTVQYTGTLT
jgi:hypothetical protein